MSAVTKGPWKLTDGDGNTVTVDYESPGYYNNLHVVSEDGRTIVGCDEYDVFLSGPERNSIIALIVAAPALVEALRAIAEMDDESDEWDAVSKYQECRDKAKAALSKAGAL